MTLTVEDGTGIVGADSYISLADANAYFIGKRLYSDAWVSDIDETKEIALRQAAMILDSEFTWSGQVKSPDQGLGWPRIGATDRSGRARDNEVPKEIKYAVCELAFFILAQDRLVGRQAVGIKRLKVDVIEVEYSEKATAPEVVPSFISRMLNGLGDKVGGRGTIKTVSLRRT